MITNLISNLSNIHNEVMTKLVPENIKNNVTILNVTGTYEGSGGSGDVKLFDTVEHMQADPNPSEGDLAIVYKSDTSNWDGSTTTRLYFPSVVNAGSTWSGSTMLQFDNGMGDLYKSGTTARPSVQISIYGQSSLTRINYSGNRAGKYTRQEDIEYIDIAEGISCTEMGDSWVNFFIVDNYEFNGLYTYTSKSDTNLFKMYTNIRIEDDEIKNDVASDIFTTDIYNQLLDVIYTNDYGEYINGSNITIVKLSSTKYNIYTVVTPSADIHYYACKLYCKEDELYPSLPIVALKDDISFSKLEIDLSDDSIIQTSIAGSVYDAVGTNYVYYIEDNIFDYPIVGIQNFDNKLTVYSLYICGEINSSYSTKTINAEYVPVTKYYPADTQLDALSDYLYMGTFYGRNGVQSGNLQAVTNLDRNDLLIKCSVFSNLSMLEPASNITDLSGLYANMHFLQVIPNINTTTVINMARMFENCDNLIAVPDLNTANVTNMAGMFVVCSKLENIPNFNTINVTNMAGMFESCDNLKTIINLDTVNVTNMASMFGGCQNLTVVSNLNTSNVVDMDDMFSFCKNLNFIPNFNTTKVTKMFSLFLNCNNITTIPNFDTSNVTNMIGMCFGCTNLVNVPELNTVNVVNIERMFGYCNNLSNASIQNIVNMCLNSNITLTSYRNLSNANWNSPLNNTPFDSSYYQDRLAELDAAGWSY